MVWMFGSKPADGAVVAWDIREVGVS